VKAYSLDLRMRVVEAYRKQQGSQRELAKRFGVSLSFIRDLMRRVRQTGSIEPKAHGGGYQTKITDDGLQTISQLVVADSDATLAELCEQLVKVHSVRISCSTMCRALKKLRLTRKKRRSMPMSAIPKLSSNRVRSTQSKSVRLMRTR
jgi:transposase